MYIFYKAHLIKNLLKPMLILYTNMPLKMTYFVLMIAFKGQFIQWSYKY